MTESLEGRFAQSLNSTALVLNSSVDRAAARSAVTRGVQRRRRLRAGMTSLAVIVAIPLIGAVAFAVLNTDGTVPAVTSSASPQPGATTSPSPSPSASISPEPEQQAWRDIPEGERPPMLENQDSREPPAREMQDWVWEHVDDEWHLYVFTVGNGEDFDLQTLFLEAPDGDTFRLFTLRTDLALNVEHWDQNRHVAWLQRHNLGDGFNVVELDLRTGDSTDDWLDSVAPTVTTDDGLVWGAAFIGTQQGGKEVWGFLDDTTTLDKVFFRLPDGSFYPTAVESELRRRWDEGFLDAWGDRGTEAWIMSDFERVVYLLQRAEYGSGNERSVVTERLWITHDLVTDEWQYFSAPLPTDVMCHSLLGRGDVVSGESIVVHCGEAGKFAVDPTGQQSPSPYVD